MDNLKQQIIEFAKKDGVDLVGFAAKSRFDGVDPACLAFLLLCDLMVLNLRYINAPWIFLF